MKKYILLVFCLTIVWLTHAQWSTAADGSTIHYTQGHVGIGTASVQNTEGWAKVLEVKGSAHAKILTSTNSIYTGLWSHDYGFFGAPAGGYAGTWSSHPFALITGSAARLVINPSGLVGIGTTVPSSTLHLYNSHVFQQRVESSGNFSGFLLKSGSAGKQLGFHFGTDGTSGHGTNELRLGRYSSSGDQSGAGWEANPVLFDLDAPDFSLTVSEEGRLGVGTAWPETKMEVFTASDFDGLRINHNNSGFVRLSANSLGQSAFNPITQSGDGGLIYGSSNQSTQYGFVLAPWASALGGLRMDKDGNVSIGASSAAGYRLAVNGSAVFTKAVVKNQTAWPDYVFAPTYRLRPLKEVEAFIHQYQHLPEVPSAQEVKEKGLDVGDTQAVLLKKIEELTLYLIEQGQELEQVKKENASLKKQALLLEQLQAEITTIKKILSHN